MKKTCIALVLGTVFMVSVAFAANNSDAVKRGEYVAVLGNCSACHAPNLAGGYPFGDVVSTNITSDPQGGIGAYSFEEFDKVMRQGIAKDGQIIIAAMPYNSYSLATKEDMEDLYAYLMQGVEPNPAKNRVVKTDKRPQTPLKPLATFKAQPNEDPVVARGRYIVEGWGHCGDCHTPRNSSGELLADVASDGVEYLAGGMAYRGAVGINLRGDMPYGLGERSEQDIIDVMKTGRNDYSAIFGSMLFVLNTSSPFMTDADLTALARFLKSLPPKDPSAKKFVVDPTVAKALWRGDDSKPGAAVYVDSCATCHKTDGTGYKRFFPELQRNPVTVADDATGIISIVLKGGTLPPTPEAPSYITMPAFGWRLSDAELADVVNFIRTSWGNKASTITAQDVEKIRNDKSIVTNPKELGSDNVDELI